VVRSVVARRDDGENAGIERVEQREIVGRREIGLEAAHRVVDDVDAVGDRVVDRAREIRRRARRAPLAGLEPARLVDRDARARRDAGDATDARAEQVRGGRVAGDDRRDVRAVAVGVARRDELVRVEIVTREKAVDVIARADDLVVARARRKTFAFLTDAAEAFRRVVLERRARALAVRPAEPQAEPRRRRPTALADARNVTLDVEQRGMVRRDAAVDEADEDRKSVCRERGEARGWAEAGEKRTEAE